MTTAPSIPLPEPPRPRPARRSAVARLVVPVRTHASRLLRLAATVLPHSLLFSAIFQKEMRVSGRKNSTFVTRTIYALMLVGLACLTFMGVRAGSVGQTGAAAIQSLQGVAPAVSSSILYFQMIFLPLIACMITGPSVCDEVRNRSLPALLTTPLSAAQIIFSKLSGALVHVVILALLSLPLLLGLRVFGGVDPALILGGAALTITTALLAGSVGMLVSVYAKRSALAGSGAVAFTLTLLFVPVPVLFLLAARGIILMPEAINTMAVICGPINLGFILVMSSSGMGPPGLWDPMDLILAGNAYNLAASVVLLALASVAFRRRLTGDRGEAVLGAADQVGLMRRAKKQRRKKGSPAPTPPLAPVDSAAPGSELAASLTAIPVAAAPEPLAEPATTGPTWVTPVNRSVGDQPVLWRELRRQGARAASRRVGLPAAVLTMAMLSVMGVFLPVYGAIEAFTNSNYSWAHSGERYMPLIAASALFALVSGGLVVLTAWRSIKRVGLGNAIVTPSRPLLVLIMVLGGLLFAYWAVDGEFAPLHFVVGAAGQGLIFLRAATQNAGTLAEEREARTWETLLTTRLSPREILLGKLAGALAKQWDIPLIVLVHFAFCGVVLSGMSPWVLVHLAATMLAGIAFLSGTGMLCALVVSKGSVASLLNAAIAMGLWLVLPMSVGMLLMAIEADAETVDAVMTTLFGGQPMTLGMFSIEGAVNWTDSPGYTYREYSIFEHSMSRGEFTVILLAVSAGYAIAGALALLAACGLFNRRTGRTS